MRATYFKAVFIKLFVASAFLCAAARSHTADGDPAVARVAQQFVQAAANGDSAAVAKVLVKDFTWTDAEGTTFAASEVPRSLPNPLLGNEAADPKEPSYGNVGTVMAERGQ